MGAFSIPLCIKNVRGPEALLAGTSTLKDVLVTEVASLIVLLLENLTPVTELKENPCIVIDSFTV